MCACLCAGVCLFVCAFACLSGRLLVGLCVCVWLFGCACVFCVSLCSIGWKIV